MALGKNSIKQLFPQIADTTAENRLMKRKIVKKEKRARKRARIRVINLPVVGKPESGPENVPVRPHMMDKPTIGKIVKKDTRE